MRRETSCPRQSSASHPCGITAQLQIVLNDSFGRQPLPAAAAAPNAFAWSGRRRAPAGLTPRRNPKAYDLPVMPLRLFAFGAGERPRRSTAAALSPDAFSGLLALAVRGAPRLGRPSVRARLVLGRVDCAGRALSPRRVRFLAEFPCRSRATILGDAPRVAAAPPRQRLSPCPHGASALTLTPARVVEAPLRVAVRVGAAGGACPSLVGVGVGVELRPRFRNPARTAAE